MWGGSREEELSPQLLALRGESAGILISEGGDKEIF